MDYFALRFMRFLLITFTTAVVASSVALAVEVPPGFADVRWGASVADSKRAFAQRPGVELAEEAPGRILFHRGQFADYPVDHWELEFGAKGFWRGAVYLTIPTGNAPDGALLRNRQFDNLAASLTKKYGKPSPQPGAANAAEVTWKLNDPATGRKGAYTVFLRYSWAPYEFLIRYSYDPSAAQNGPPASGTKGNKDL
ncbi:MAG: hypothetical protein JWL59_3091 [Chthoniobacteraceae bacterium]|nr:hypothetical protein [Chthoniobacteraceae bacterium]